ncbi:MAG: ATP-dependent DNA helicase UvrD/REP family [Candidatus Woesebacteria bacterium GW2011_GWA2_40_7]|uniref:DNA 3'-5' helicase n=3 Tax=Candidatus Woeseibacteriota TaxID=1752722 RepID=A0A0G0UTT2_9BACT|nr:MAG: ATP-dependent DNA helicase UvrD/REP family [Candidatus Woesebacteria bacterium GW2011_GWB1_39_10]KKR72099.1 MAG: ATP-dependent DNA helicase UvrD/REP family [Candidatus Woesebacteria bacterium GW2011_GWA2_40_7]KKR92144.1 MAG: ATP-dependent DNA helicase UvrD/REP family [Candidatus Woesebacteria bacterium GW2011_GWA1_41_13b]
MLAIDYKSERTKDTSDILDSTHLKKVVIAGPGTGKSYLFAELIRKKREQGKSDFLAITFVGKLGDSLADDLCGLAKTTTMHSFARDFVLKYCKGWNYYPRMLELIAEDLKQEGIKEFTIGDENYEEKTKYYKAVGDADVVHYAVQICKKDESKTPIFDLILVDEYQDFNAIESEFVDLLAVKSEIVIVGDDDQALYSFKGSSPSFIREKYDLGNTYWESHTLRFCSRCTEVVIKYFDAIVDKYNLKNSSELDPKKRRVEKKYICYMPDKESDSKLNPKIHLIKNCPVGMIARKIRHQLAEMAKNQKIKDILVIGEARSCQTLLKTVGQQLKNYGFKNVDLRDSIDVIPLQQDIVDAYKFIVNDAESLLGWRILNNPIEADKNGHLKNAKTLNTIINGSPSDLKKISQTDIQILENTIENWKFYLNKDKSKKDQAKVPDEPTRCDQNELIRKDVLTRELKSNNLSLSRPLSNLNITICNVLNSKGLSADVVFLIGFDQGRFPLKTEVSDSEVYQMLVALTRAKKRVYLINTIDRKVSDFSNCMTKDEWNIETVDTIKND